MDPTAPQPAPRRFTFPDGRSVDRIGLGTMRLTGQPANFGPYPDWQAGVALVRRALALGVEFIDTAWSYGPEHADRLIGEALDGQDGAERVMVATKGGVDKPAVDRIVTDGSPERLRQQIEGARRNLRRDRIDLFQLHRPDPTVAIERSVEAMARARDAGHVRHIGLSNVTSEQVERALTVAPIASVQNRYNRDDRADDDLVAFTAERGIAFIPHGPLGANPMRPGAAIDPAEAIAWLLRRSPNILVISGTTSVAHLEENMRAWERA